MSNACCNSLSLSSYHLPVPLDPLVDSLVACQRLTSLDLSEDLGRVTLFLQKGLHNLRAQRLVGVSLSDGEVSSSEEEASSSEEEGASSSSEEEASSSSDEASDERVSD